LIFKIKKNIYGKQNKCSDLFPRNKIIEILKQHFSFFPIAQSLGENCEKYLSLMRTRCVLSIKWLFEKWFQYGSWLYLWITHESSHLPVKPEVMDLITIQIRLVVNKDFDLKTICPIVSINLNKKNIDNLINEKDITFMNVEKGLQNL
jgi:hypothetical protein